MDSGTAAIIGAAIGFVGSLVGTVIAPYILRRAERKEADERARRDALRRIIPGVIEAGARLQATNNPSTTDAAIAFRHVTELETWITPDEWPIGRMAMLGILPAAKAEPSSSAPKRFRATIDVLPRWMRGEITAAEGKSLWEKTTGDKLQPLVDR